MSASNDVSMHFSRTHWGKKLKCSLNLKTPFLRFVYISWTLTSLLTSYLHRRWAAAREHQRTSRLIKPEVPLPTIAIIFSFHLFNSVDRWKFDSISFKFNMASNISIDSAVSDVFFAEQVSNEPSPKRHNSLNILDSTELSMTLTTGLPSLSSIAPPEP